MSSDALSIITEDIYNTKTAFCSIVTNNSITFEREAGFAIQCISSNEYMMKVAIGNRQSVVDAVTNIAAIGISLNPAKKQAYLVPRNQKVCLDISYMGLMDLALDSGSIKWAQAALVHKADKFALNGYDKPPEHSFDPFSNDRGAIVGVYVVVKTADNEYLTHTMKIDDVLAIRDRSEAWKAFVAKKTKSCPWATDEAEMIKKTCVKQAYKYWPKSERLEKAIHYLNTETEEKLEFTETNTVLEVKPSKSVARETFDKLTLEEQENLRNFGMHAISMLAKGDIAGAYDYIESLELESDDKLAMWSLFESQYRTALKKEGVRRRNDELVKKAIQEQEPVEFEDVPH